MADESYSLGEVAESLGVSKAEVVQRVHHGEFPGRFLTADLEMRIPARDVRRALERRPNLSGIKNAALVAGEAGGLEAWSRERELLEGFLSDRDDRLEALIREGFTDIHRRLDELRQRLDAMEWDGVGLGALESGVELDQLLLEVRALEHMAGLDGSED